MEPFNLTPDPKVLIALTRTPMQPMDALCELIDNAIDSFEAAELKGISIDKRSIYIDLPSNSDLKDGLGRVTIRDNGAGMDEAQAEAALRAGYTGNNAYDSLGLFGMGFNISTGKFGLKTTLITVPTGRPKAVSVVIDLESIRKSKSYLVMPKLITPPSGFTRGTIVEISDWWANGTPNADFCKKLVQYGMPTVRREIGRRYATILRRSEKGAISIYVNGEICKPFEHCIWSETRFVTHRSLGQIHAQIRFDQVIGQHVRCTQCTAIVQEGKRECPGCGASGGLRSIQERVTGWLGIQRFDSTSEYGVDLVRKGRTIRIGEKAAFFEFTDELKRIIRDYPIDSQYGRIVGEIHMDHVPVDFLKQDFQRSSPEWQRALEFIRGNTSLQPEQPNASLNKSPLFKLYQGYRRVRYFGKQHMYMGYYDSTERKAKRISRDIEKDYYEKFLNREPGYFDDEKWWELVESADRPPIPEMVICPSCRVENEKDADQCSACGNILKAKACINSACGKSIPFSAHSCPFCSESQILHLETPWHCEVCGSDNSPTINLCSTCGNKQGTPNPVSRDALISNSDKFDELSINGCNIKLADGTNSSAMDISVYASRVPLKPYGARDSIPAICLRTEASHEIYLDFSHAEFGRFGITPESIVAYEAGIVIHLENSRLISAYPNIHTVHNIAWQFLYKYYVTRLEDSSETVREDSHALFSSIRERIAKSFTGRFEEAYQTLSEVQVGNMVRNLQHSGRDISHLLEMKACGDFLLFIDESAIVDLFREFPDLFFDGAVWIDRISGLQELPSNVLKDVRERTIMEFKNCLEDVVSFLQTSRTSQARIKRCRFSLDILEKALAD